jgi:Ala-tRNA(Pro) deacylase
MDYVYSRNRVIREETIMPIPTKVKSYLVENGIQFEAVSHPKSFSSAETAAVAHIRDDHIAKGVIVGDETGFVLVVIPASEWVNMDRVREELDRDLHLASEEEVDKLFPGCDPGAVPPFGEAFDIPILLDEALTSLAKVYMEAGDHEELILVESEQFHSLMKGVRHGHFSQSV